ncbi:hypothetical protein HZS_4200 [Henneguya salminicola]|nr:hypothetical protein HZS_4200 [Henneguya salminicola]
MYHQSESKTPIIIVPKAPSSMINLNTVASFIQDFKFDSSGKSDSSFKDSHILIYRKKDKVINGQLQNVSIPYICVDSTDKLSGSDCSSFSS